MGGPLDAAGMAELKRWRVVPDRVAHWAEHQPDARFIKCTGDWITYGRLAERVEDLAGGLTALGISRGDRVAVILPNCEEFVLTIFALARIGAVQVPTSVYLRGDLLHHQLTDSRAKALIADAAGVEEANRLRATLPDLQHVVAVGADRAEGTIAFDSVADSGMRAPAVDLAPADLLSIIYTSGTTGLPKGCMLSHGYYTSLSWGWYAYDWYRPGDEILTGMPLFHIAGQGANMIAALMGGLSIEILPSFSAGEILDHARKSGSTVLYGVGAMGLDLMATEPRPDDRDHNLRTTIFPAGPPIPPEMQEQWRERFGVEIICEGYGQTECVTVLMSPSGRQRGSRACLGSPVPELEVAILDDTGHRLGAGKVGEIVVRPLEPQVVFGGYWEKPAATAEAWRGLWHHTGDRARLEDDGTFTFIDRRSHLLRRRGENISTVELEAAIIKHPDIAAVAVHGVTYAIGDDDVKAWVVAEDGTDLKPADLHAFLVDTLPYFAVPRYVQLIDELPVSALGRVQKFLLKERSNEDAWDFEELGLSIAVADRRAKTASRVDQPGG